MRIGSNVLSTKAQNQNIVVAHFSAYFSKMFFKALSALLFVSGREWCGTKICIRGFFNWMDWYQKIGGGGGFGCSLFAELLGWGSWGGGSFCQLFFLMLWGNGRTIVSAGLKIPKNAKISKLKERKKKLKYFMMREEGWFFFFVWGGDRGVLFSCNFLFSLAQDGFFLIFGVMPKSVHIFQSYIAKNLY